MRRTARTLATAAVIGIIATILPLVAASPASAARQKTIKIADASIVEGDAGQKTLTFTLTWTGAKGGSAVQVHYATADATATAGSDYTSTSGTAAFNNGCKCATVGVPVLGDTMTEGTETFVVNLSSPVNAAIGDAQAVGTIYDNEGPPAFVVTDASADENVASGKISFSVLMTNSSSGTKTVDYATADGTAVAGSDYTAKSGTLTFTSGQTSKTVDVLITDDALSEANETFTLNLSNASLAIDDATGLGTIVDDDAEPTLTVANVSAAETAGTLTFTITASAVSGQEMDVDYATADSTAAAGQDYAATSGTAVIPLGATTATVDVPITDDAVYEGDETFVLNLSGEYNAVLGTAQATGTITEDEAMPTVSIADAGVTEGNAGTVPATFDVTLSHASAFSTSVAWTTAAGTATAGSDYTAASGTASFAAGETTAQISVDVLGDALVESNETFTVTLSSPSGLLLGTATGTGTITDDDATPTVSIGDVTVTEGNTGTTTATFDVTLSGPSGLDTSVAWTTADGTAAAGTDYTAGSGTVSFPAGQTTAQISVDALGDSVVEPSETFSVTLSTPNGLILGTVTGTGTITDDDRLPTALTLKVIATKTRVGAQGLLESATADAQVTVTLAKRKSGAWVQVGSPRTVTVTKLGDRDKDGKADAQYRASFKRPRRGNYKLTVTFAGTSVLMPTTKTATFKL